MPAAPSPLLVILSPIWRDTYKLDIVSRWRTGDGSYGYDKSDAVTIQNLRRGNGSAFGYK